MAKSNSSFMPPHSIEAEKAVLGGILRRAEHFNLIMDKVKLSPEYFFNDTHRKIYEAIIKLDERNDPIDIIAVTEVLTHATDASSNFSPIYLVELTEQTPIEQNLEYYANIVRKKYYLRRIITACHDTAQKAMNAEGEVSSFIEQVEREFLLISNAHDQGEGLVSAKDTLVPTLESLEKRIQSGGQLSGITTGFRDLDNIFGGWHDSDLVILAARPGMGKTALGLNWAMNALKKEEPKIAIFTLEMTRSQLVERLISAEGRIDSSSLRKGDLSEEDQDRLMTAARYINENGHRLLIDETPGISVGELRSRCRRFKKEHGLDIIFIDYLQLMSASEVARKQGREREISEISTGLKSLAKELSVPIIALAQLNRGPDARPDKRPRISDLRESGSMEQDADLILFVYRDDYYNPNSENAGKAEIIVSKNRHGETSSVYLAWLPNFVSFHNLVN